MIRKSEPLSIAEAEEYIGKEQEEIKIFFNKFDRLKLQQAKDLREKLNGLNLVKLNEKSISKIIDFLPTTSEEINKILSEVSLDEDESKKIIEIVKEFK